MAEEDNLDLEKHKKQIESYAKARPHYVIFANALERILKEACLISIPEAFVQKRAKGVSSFAEKVARKYDRYPDAVNQMTDLCGARIIVQTTEQVKAVRRFIESNFVILESEDKGLLLGDQEFGYRDMHYIIKLRPDRDAALGISKKERTAIQELKAEIQIRTWVQHAWADTLHDRMYKNKLKISSEAKRTGNLLAALMEEGDNNFRRLADELDGLIANYTATASKGEIEKEIEIQKLVLNSEVNEPSRPGLALKLARLLAASGDDAQVIKLLERYDKVDDPNRCELLLTLGHSLCRSHRNDPSSPKYRQGRRYTEQALDLCRSKEIRFVPDLRKKKSLHARVLAQLGWILKAMPKELHQARKCYQLAHEHEPSNPYYLADMLSLEMRPPGKMDLPASMRTTIREAVKICRSHAVAGIELPYAYFTAGRLELFLGNSYEGLGYYARGIGYCNAGTHFIPEDIFAVETNWLKRIYARKKIPEECQRAIDLLSLGKTIQSGAGKVRSKSPLSPPILIIAGCTENMKSGKVKEIRPLLVKALGDFGGTVISGGTTSGVPGCVGDIAVTLANRRKKSFRLTGYLPAKLSPGISLHPGFDDIIEADIKFSPEQILRYWRDILAKGIHPESVLLLGFGGEPLTVAEYCIALGMGASVGIVADMGNAAKEFIKDALWASLPNLYPLPSDVQTMRAFVLQPDHPFDPAVHEELAKSFHSEYVNNSTERLPASMLPWDQLDITYKKANLEQAQYSIRILKAAGFGVRKAKRAGSVPKAFVKKIEEMAEMEHGRWIIERLRDGWRYGKVRDDSKKIHSHLVPWAKLPENIKVLDRRSVEAYPKILAKAGLEIIKL
jgi:ppGpp synthetase/RelA/SpoT-type nucleotidyltranferase